MAGRALAARSRDLLKQGAQSRDRRCPRPHRVLSVAVFPEQTFLLLVKDVPAKPGKPPGKELHRTPLFQRP